MQKRRKLKLILDTNIWISYLITDRLKFLDSLIYAGRVKLVFSGELFGEFIAVAQRPKFRKYFNAEDIRVLIRLIECYGIFIRTTSRKALCRDAKDQFLLDLAIDSKADYLVTGDHDLLVLKSIERTSIIGLTELKEIFDSSDMQ